MSADIKFLKDLIKDIKIGIKSKLNKSAFNKISLEVKEDIQKRVQQGWGVDEHNGKRKKLKALKPSTIARRKKLKKKGKLSSKTKPAKSNQTESGKMVDSLVNKATSDGFSIEVSDKERQKVLEYQEDSGREWLYLNKKEAKKVHEMVEQAIENTLDNIFKD